MDIHQQHQSKRPFAMHISLFMHSGKQPVLQDVPLSGYDFRLESSHMVANLCEGYFETIFQLSPPYIYDVNIKRR